MARNYNVFISHSWSHHSDLEALRNLINLRAYFHASYSEVSRDEPINSLNASYIKTRLKEKLQSSDVIIALAGIYASHSEWMEWELDTAQALGKKIIGLVPRGNERVSTMVSSRSSSIIRWNTESIITAIRAYAI
jgi:hypothetical protein